MPPFTVNVNGAVPMTTALGLNEEIDGSGYCTTTDMLFELPPPGDGVATVTGRLPTFEAVIADAGIAAVRRALLTYVVGWLTPFHCTTEAATKLLPMTVKVKEEPPTVTVAGETD